VLFLPIQPSAADLAVYYDLDSLAPAAGGNRDSSPSRTRSGPVRGQVSKRNEVAAVRDTGVLIDADPVVTGGVAVTDLVSPGAEARGSRG
jgi:hypothetical protein